jgi:hypothetical protein
MILLVREVQGLTAKTYIHRAGAKAAAVLEHLDAGMLLHSVRHFPDNRTLEGEASMTTNVDAAPSLGENQSHNEDERYQSAIYDPAFVLPALCFALETGQVCCLHYRQWRSMAQFLHLEELRRPAEQGVLKDKDSWFVYIANNPGRRAEAADRKPCRGLLCQVAVFA